MKKNFDKQKPPERKTNNNTRVNSEGLIYEDSVINKLEIRRLVCNRLQPAQNRTYTGVALNEQNPSPRYVYVDSEISIRGNY